MRLLCWLLLTTGVAAMLLQPAVTPAVSRRSTTAQMALPDMLVNQISICAGNIRVKQDPRYLTMLPYQAQKLPLEYCSSWPIWVTNPGGKVPLSRVPVPEAALDEWWTTWVPPAAFEQLWLPDSQVIGVAPFLLAGTFWEPLGWMWANVTADGSLTPRPVFMAVKRLRCELQGGAGCM